MNRQLHLDGQWQFRQAGRGRKRIGRWLPAAVPGTVHTDLLAAGRIKDPFYRLNELDQQWIEQADWAYRRTFDVAATFLDQARAIWLDFDGLDTFATVRLNGREVGRADNMFHPWRFDVKRLLRAGANTLDVEFASAVRVADDRARASKTAYNGVFFKHRVYIRKAQCAGGWDWGPRFMTCGIWRPVRLLAVEHAEIRDVHVTTRSLTDQRATLDVAVEIESHATTPAILQLELTCRATRQTIRGQVKARLGRGRRVVRTRVVVHNPRRWWPAGMGEQALYDLRATLLIHDQPADARDQTVGLRTVELVRQKDAQGESFRFRINGRDLFCKGANWIPADSFLPRVGSQVYRDRLTAARDAHMNMVRVWGGGVYEDPAFYRTCDELGLLVWQDFMFACAEYPEAPAFLAAVRREAEHVVRRLRNHPSVVIWCGNNENEWLWERRWPWSPRFVGRRIFHQVLPTICRRLDPSRPYWPGSPWGGKNVNDPDRGNQHVWTVWSFWEKPHTYRDWPARFVTEFGFQGMPPARTVRRFTAPPDRKLFTRVLDHHNRMDQGHPRMMKYLADSLGVPRDLDDYTYLSQVLQADVIKIGVEHWRRRWPMSAGAIYWQLNDCWPVMSWSAIDYFGEPKALWYASRRFFAPLLVSLRPVSPEPYGPTDLEVWITHDQPASEPVQIEAAAWRLDGQRLGRKIIPTRLPAGGSRQVALLSYDDMRLSQPDSELVYVRLRRARRTLAHNTHYFAPDKYLDWPKPQIRASVRRTAGRFDIELRTERPARAVCLTADRWDGQFSDNFFDLLPNEPYRVTWTPTRALPPAAEFRRALAIRAMTATGRP